ncbi:hypothetical protein CMV30_10310 [Nibricoccus aquaticus]|uniref:3-keto-disaccharide hydrolase domain-containing protein n=1 Tax=Nibricoccus aquaticus TaxID=2576891 RepID=A0A290Q6L3_9BACT|nr:family 16 glycoside hydrolase [Nibricoccus aquaticus]ATC64315.1 hypothetical protein CMV30_10310 [Nibricoccus aquaticus]
MRSFFATISLLICASVAAHAQRIDLWNGRDLTGWKIFLTDATVDPATVWSMHDGALRLDAKKINGYIRTEKSFANYRLHVEWRWDAAATERSNSGVMLHVNGPDLAWPAAFEAQLKTGNAGQVVGMGLDIPDAPLTNNRKRAERLAPPSEKPHGEWNSYDIVVRDATIEVSVNGVRQNFVQKLPVTSGNIALQMEGAPIEFRNVWLEPLMSEKKSPLTSQLYDWEKMPVTPTPKGARRDVFDGPTSSLDVSHCHITTLNPGQDSGEPRLHTQEEIIIVKEGRVEAHIDGRTETGGPGSIFHFVANATTRLRNAGDTPTIYIVVYFRPLTTAPKS